MTRKILTLCLLCSLASGLSAQSIERYVIGSAGGSWNNGTTFVDYTAGELAIATLNSANNFLTQGFQQASSGVIAVEENPQDNGAIVTYPNPAVDLINLGFSGMELTSCRIMVMDVLGQLLLDTKTTVVSGTIVPLDLSNFATGQYYLRIYGNDELIHTGAFIKIHQ